MYQSCDLIMPSTIAMEFNTSGLVIAVLVDVKIQLQNSVY
jgi:hypothetical protein